MSMREKDSSDFDLELFIDLFDEALTSDDPSVQKTLQHLMVITALARNHAKHDRFEGPLRRLFDNVHNLNRRLDRLESENARRSAPETDALTVLRSKTSGIAGRVVVCFAGLPR